MSEASFGWTREALKASACPTGGTALSDGLRASSGSITRRTRVETSSEPVRWGGPARKPPWGELVAVNANTGDIAWRVPLGITEELPEDRQETGRLNFGGPMSTAGGLVFIGASNDGASARSIPERVKKSGPNRL